MTLTATPPSPPTATILQRFLDGFLARANGQDYPPALAGIWAEKGWLKAHAIIQEFEGTPTKARPSPAVKQSNGGVGIVGQDPLDTGDLQHGTRSPESPEVRAEGVDGGEKRTESDLPKE
jgi:hypothetical protein